MRRRRREPFQIDVDGILFGLAIIGGLTFLAVYIWSLLR